MVRQKWLIPVQVSSQTDVFIIERIRYCIMSIYQTIIKNYHHYHKMQFKKLIITALKVVLNKIVIFKVDSDNIYFK